MMGTLQMLAEAVAKHIQLISLQIVILVAVIWVAERILIKSSPLFRYWLWFIVLIRLCIPVSLSMPHFVNNMTGSILVSLQSTIKTSGLFRFLSNDIPGKSTLSAAIEHSPSIPNIPFELIQSEPVLSFNTYGLIWFSVSLLLVIIIASRIFRVWRLLKNSVTVERPDLIAHTEKLARQMDIYRGVDLYYMDRDDMNVPATIGIVHPKIFLPSEIADDWELQDITPILLHELAHVKRLDLAVNWVQMLIQAVYFFHPLVWFANRRLRELREEICDDMAIETLGCDRRAYTSSILHVIENITTHRKLRGVEIGLTFKSSRVFRRIKRILASDYKLRTEMPMASITALIIIGFTGFAISCSHLTNTAPPENVVFDQKALRRNDAKISCGPNIKENTESVILNGVAMVRGTDYTIDYQSGVITLINEKLHDPRADIQVKYEEKNRPQLENDPRSDRSSRPQVALKIPFNVNKGSVELILNKKPLVENKDYRVDYKAGEIIILTQEIQNSGSDIQLKYTSRKEDTRNLKINLYDNDNSSSSSSSSQSDSPDLIPLNAKISYENGSRVYVMGLPTDKKQIRRKIEEKQSQAMYVSAGIAAGKMLSTNMIILNRKYPVAIISFTNPYENEVSVEVFDESGNLVETIKNNRTLKSGRHTVNWDSKPYSSGIYFCRIKNDDSSNYMKLVVR